MTLTFEDFPPGRFGTFGPRHVTRDEILAFAAEFDPQPMHLDDEAASKSMLRGLSGSGWHLCSLMMRMMADGFITRAASLGRACISKLTSWRRLNRGSRVECRADLADDARRP